MNVVIKVNDELKNKMMEYYKDKMRDKKIPYTVFQAKDGDTVVTMYESGKVMFQGVSADVDAARWEVEKGNTEEEKERKKREDKKYYNCNSVGSDEVGTGDYFGPIVVSAAYVKKEDIPYLEELKVGDSKRIEDEVILEIAPKIAKRITYRSIILDNEEYNEKYNKDINLNKIKAILHNKMLYKLIHEENPKYDYIIVDEFARERRYYNYLIGQDEVQRNITFITKAEDKNMAVACASIISRYLFLKEFDKLCDKVHVPLPKGAGKDVDKAGEELVEKYGKDILKSVSKLNFRNTQRILHTLVY